MAKYYLDENGVRILVNAFDASLSNKVDKSDLNQYATKEDLANVDVDLTGYATQDYVDNKVADIEAYDDSEVRNLIDGIEAKTSGLYHFKGSVADLTALQAIESPEVGDTYNLADTGMNAAWTGSEWDEFGSITDLSEYLKIEEVQAITETSLNAILYSGKSAVVNDIAGFKAMLANNQSEIKITVNEDVALDEPLLVPAGKKVVLNLDGGNISSTGQIMQVSGEVELQGGELAANSTAVTVVQGGKLTIDGTSISSATGNGVSATGEGSELIINSGSVNAQEYGIGVYKNAEITINGGHIQGRDNFALGGNGSAGLGGANVTINGGILEGHITSPGYIATAIYWPNAGILTINGGTIISDGAGIVQRGGTINLNDGTSIVANGATGVLGKAGDSKITVGPYAIVYDQKANYPDAANMQLNIANGVILQGTDGDISILLADGAEANIVDNRQ